MRQALQVSMLTLLFGACAAPGPSEPASDGVPAPNLAGLERICRSDPPEVEVFEQDAQAYADAFGVTVDEAMERLALQGVEGIQDAGVAAAPGLWAAYWLEHEPDFGYVLFYKGEPDDVAHVREAVADCSIPILVRSGATHSERELLAKIERLSSSGRLDPPMPSLTMYPDAKSGAIVLGGPTDPGPKVLDQIAEIAGVPVRYVEEPSLEEQ